MNAFTDTRARKIISPYLRIWGRGAPCVQLRRRNGSFDFLRQKTRPIYNARVTAWCRCAKAQQGDLHNMAISTNNYKQRRTWHLGLHAWQCLKWHAACLLRAPIWEPIGQYLGVSNNYSPTIHNSHGCYLEVSSLKIIILWRYEIPATTHYKERKL